MPKSPGTKCIITGDLGTTGVGYNLMMPLLLVLVAENIKPVLVAAMAPLGLASSGRNSLFWVVHPGSHLIMNSYEKLLRLEPGKLASHVRSVEP